MAIREQDRPFPDSNPHELSRALLPSQVEYPMSLDRQPAENGDSFEVASPTGFRCDVNGVISKIARDLVCRALAERVCDLLQSDQVERAFGQFAEEQRPTLTPAGSVIQDIHTRDTEDHIQSPAMSHFCFISRTSSFTFLLTLVKYSSAFLASKSGNPCPGLYSVIDEGAGYAE